jgi:hypothetical protein
MIDIATQLGNMLPEDERIPSPFGPSLSQAQTPVFWQSRGIQWKKKIGNLLEISPELYKEIREQIRNLQLLIPDSISVL